MGRFIALFRKVGLGRFAVELGVVHIVDDNPDDVNVVSDSVDGLFGGVDAVCTFELFKENLNVGDQISVSTLSFDRD